jgi:hypothetical protein
MGDHTPRSLTRTLWGTIRNALAIQAQFLHPSFFLFFSLFPLTTGLRGQLESLPPGLVSAIRLHSSKGEGHKRITPQQASAQYHPCPKVPVQTATFRAGHTENGRWSAWHVAMCGAGSGRAQWGSGVQRGQVGRTALAMVCTTARPRNQCLQG